MRRRGAVGLPFGKRRTWIVPATDTALHSWATALLADLRPELSLYYAVYSTLDEEGNAGWPGGTEHIVWDEIHEVVPSRWELQCRASSSDRSASATRPGAVAAASRRASSRRSRLWGTEDRSRVGERRRRGR